LHELIRNLERSSSRSTPTCRLRSSTFLPCRVRRSRVALATATLRPASLKWMLPSASCSMPSRHRTRSMPGWAISRQRSSSTPAAARYFEHQQQRRRSEQLAPCWDHAPPKASCGVADDFRAKPLRPKGGVVSPEGIEPSTYRSAGCRPLGLLRKILEPLSAPCRQLHPIPSALVRIGVKRSTVSGITVERGQ